mgnify:CR=1 FL=1
MGAFFFWTRRSFFYDPPPTDREILEQGRTLAIDEACLSLKIYLGHAAALADPGYLFIIPVDLPLISK